MKSAATLREIIWTGGGNLFLHDDPTVQQPAVQYAMQQYGNSEQEIRNGLFGSSSDVGAGRRAADRGRSAGDLRVQRYRIHAVSLIDIVAERR